MHSALSFQPVLPVLPSSLLWTTNVVAFCILLEIMSPLWGYLDLRIKIYYMEFTSPKIWYLRTGLTPYIIFWFLGLDTLKKETLSPNNAISNKSLLASGITVCWSYCTLKIHQTYDNCIASIQYTSFDLVTILSNYREFQ